MPDDAFAAHPLSRFVRLNPDIEVRAYLQGGYSHEEAEAWVSAGIPAWMADNWQWYGFDLAVAAALTARSVEDPASAHSLMWNERLQVVIPWPSYGITDQNEILSLGNYVERGFTVYQAIEWFYTAEEMWVDYPANRDLLPDLEATGSEEWVAAGVVDVHEAVAWLRAGVARHQVSRWIDSQVGPDVAIAWRTANVDLALAVRWVEAGVRDLNAATEYWRGPGFEPMPRHVTAACVRAGLGPSEAMALDASSTSTLRALELMHALQVERAPSGTHVPNAN